MVVVMAVSTWVYRKSDGQYLRGGFYDPTFDPAIEATEQFQDADPHPDVRLQRGPGRRPATAPEIAAYDDAQATVAGDLSTQKLLLATVIFFTQRQNEVRTQPTQVLPALSAQAVRDGILTIYKGL